MRHNKSNKRLGRTTGHRKALLRNQLASLIKSERIITTLVKAKEMRPIAEKFVTLGKKGTLHDRRHAAQSLTEDAVVAKLFGEIAPRFAERAGGYTRIIKLGPRRGDGAEMAILEFVDYEFDASAAKKSAGKDKKKAAKAEASNVKSDETAEKKEAGEDKKAEKKKAAKKAGKKSDKKDAKKDVKKSEKKAAKKDKDQDGGKKAAGKKKEKK